MSNQNPETKQCQNCQQNFIVEPEDFAFYDKIKVPPPTWCPECRIVRRMIWRNERTLYKRRCDAHGHNEDIISIYSATGSCKVYDNQYWWSDEWDALSYGCDYDFSKSFFEQFKALIKEVPQNNLITRNNINSPYVNYLVDSKNCYMVIGGKDNEDSTYANHVVTIKNSSDLYFANTMELGYEDVICQNSYNLLYGQNSENCLNSYFLYDCKNCSNCFGCVGLRNKQYYISNVQYSKEEYQEKLKEFNLGSFFGLEKQSKIFNNLKLNYPHRFINSTKTADVSGDNISEAKNCHYVFDILSGGSENCKFMFWGGQDAKEVYDGVGVGVKGELLYENAIVTQSVSRVSFSAAIWTGYNINYSYNCLSSSNLFGCVSLKNKQYCILNKQYTKEEYETLVPKIIEQMNTMPYTDKQGRVYKYGEFFPFELSPFCYNETIAQEYFPLTKKQALEKGYSWKDQQERNITITKKSEDLPDHITDVPDSITKEIISCQHQGSCNEQCTTAFKIIPQELEFYRKMNLPLPRLCPNCRHYQRLKQRNPLKLWHRQCGCGGEKSTNEVYLNTIQHPHGTSSCSNEFETSYSPDRLEIVYCEQCYQQEVV